MLKELARMVSKPALIEGRLTYDLTAKVKFCVL